MRVFFAVVALSAVGFLAGCDRKQDSIWKWKYSEIKRVVSPDAKVDAVIVDGDAGAVTRTTTFIFLVPHGAKVDEENDDNRPVFRADDVKNLNLVWSKPKFLEIHFDEARVIQFQNYWQSREAEDFHYLVETRLFPEKDSSLPLELREW